MSRSWSWRPAGPHDREAQRRLFNLSFRKQKGLDTFHWKYDANPHGQALQLVACDRQERVVGAYAYVPRRFRHDGRTVTLMQASDAMVDPVARRQGIFTGLDDVVAGLAGEQGVPLAFAYSGRLSYQGFLSNGWQQLGAAPVLRYRYRTGRGLRRLGRLGPLLSGAAPLLDVLTRLRDRRRLAGSPAQQALVPLARFDERADELFEASVPARGLTGERDARWLNWRYVDTPSRRQECFALPAAGGRALDGWLVAEFVDGNAYLVDHLARHEEARATLLLGFTALAFARGMDEATALLFDHHPASPALRSLGWPRPVQRRLFRDMFPFIVRACREDLDPLAEPMERWFLADGDRDAEHMSP